MDFEFIYLLLQIVKNNGDVRKLTREGLTFADVANLTSYALGEKLLCFKDNVLMLDLEGESMLAKLNEYRRPKTKKEWITEEDQSKIFKISKDFIYLPNPTTKLF